MRFLWRLLSHFRRHRPAERNAPAAPAVADPGGGFAVIDVETTGLSPHRHRVLEIAVVRTDRTGHIIDEWSTLVDPGGPVGATHIHGITANDVRNAPAFAEVIGELASRIEGFAVVAHNASFDLAFVRAEFQRAGRYLPELPTMCTLQASHVYLPQLDRRRLADCCWAAGIELRDAHSALADARATAMLLAHYLSPDFGRAPLREHVVLPDLARRMSWPHVAHQPVRVVNRRTSVVAAAPGTLWALLDALPLSTVVDEGAPTVASAYLELLYQVFEDGVLTDDEARSLAELAGAYSLTSADVEATHRAFLLALAHQIVEDGTVTQDERRLIRDAAAALGVDDTPNKILKEAHAAMQAHHGHDCQPLPPDWPHGRPLVVGQGVTFTGGDPFVRARLEVLARAAGLRVTGSVSGRTAALVTDGADPNTTKAVAARRFGTRVVTPDLFAVLVRYVQPLESADRPAEVTSPEVAAAEDPAAIRAWARANGLPVGVRGRISSEVLAAYRGRAVEPAMT